MILSGDLHTAVRAVVGLGLIMATLHVLLVTVGGGRDVTTLVTNIFLPSPHGRLRIVWVTLIVEGASGLLLPLPLLLLRDLPRVAHLEVSQQCRSRRKLQFAALVRAEEDCGQGDVLVTVLQYGGGRQSRHGGLRGIRPETTFRDKRLSLRSTWCQCE